MTVNLRESRPQFSLFGPGGRWASDPELAAPFPTDSDGWAEQLLEGRHTIQPEPKSDAEFWARRLLN
jgi:hypothetical protein